MTEIQIDIEEGEEKFAVCHGDSHNWDFMDPRGGGQLLVHERRGKSLTRLRREVQCRQCGTIRITYYTCRPDGSGRTQDGGHTYKYPNGYLSKDHPEREVILRGDWTQWRAQALPIATNGHRQ